MQAADTATIRFDPNGQPQALQRAVAFLKVLGHEGRLELLCHMIDGAQSVGALTQALGSSQPAVSQHLMRLRAALCAASLCFIPSQPPRWPRSSQRCAMPFAHHPTRAKARFSWAGLGSKSRPRFDPKGIEPEP